MKSKLLQVAIAMGQYAHHIKTVCMWTVHEIGMGLWLKNPVPWRTRWNKNENAHWGTAHFICILMVSSEGGNVLGSFFSSGNWSLVSSWGNHPNRKATIKQMQIGIKTMAGDYWVQSVVQFGLPSQHRGQCVAVHLYLHKSFVPAC